MLTSLVIVTWFPDHNCKNIFAIKEHKHVVATAKIF